jgi:hypothetical protein
MHSRITKLILVNLVAVAVVTTPLSAHHSFIAEFDALKRVNFTGVITKVDWGNPHVWFFVDVKDEATGTVTNWGAELGGPNLLIRNGWSRHTLKIGMVVSFVGSLAKDGTHRVNASRIVVDGKRLDAASSESAGR